MESKVLVPRFKHNDVFIQSVILIRKASDTTDNVPILNTIILLDHENRNYD